MINRKDVRLLVLASLACLVQAQTAAPAKVVRKPIFVSPELLEASLILPSPPTTEGAAEDLKEIHRIQQTRSAARVAQAQADDAEEDMFVFKDVLGEKFNPQALPLTALLSTHVKNDESVIVNPAKNFFKRPRPYFFDATVKPVCKVSTNPADYSYPSGHGTTGFLEALTLTMMVPEKRDAILARADDYAYSREVCGVHYPSDEVASKKLAYAMIGVMLTNPQYRKELADAKAETRKALGF
jgi:acid phosphatase (class A)